MDSQVIFSAHAPVEIIKPHRLGFRYSVLEARVYLAILVITQKNTAIRGIEKSLKIFRECF